MANEIYTRIQLKYDSYANWTSHNPTLLAGEIAIAKLVTGTQSDATGDQTSTAPVLFKVGPGAFNSLPWVSGLAADVYAWAKKSTPDWTDFPALPITVEDKQTGKFVTDITFSNNVITISRADVAWTDLTGTSPLSNYKTKQTAVADPTASGNATSFIATITQNENGEIVATKKNIDLSSFATKEELSSAMVFRGTLGTGGTVVSLPSASATTEGDAYKVITAGTYASTAAKVGDMFVCCKPTGSTTYSWVLIPSGDEPSGTVTNVAAGDGLTTEDGKAITSSGTIKHAVPSGAAAGKTSPNAEQTPGYGQTFNIPVVETDKFGHIIGKSTTTVKIPEVASVYALKEGATANAGTDKETNPKYLIFNCGSSTTVI